MDKDLEKRLTLQSVDPVEVTEDLSPKEISVSTAPLLKDIK